MKKMRLFILAAGLALAAGSAASAAAVTKFWNLTAHTVNDLELAPAGTTNFGPNLCLADPDKSVDADERLKIADVKSGHYDVRLKDTSGRACTVKNVEVTAGKIFSIDEKQLTDCTK
jgi:hypothetical protein